MFCKDTTVHLDAMARYVIAYWVAAMMTTDAVHHRGLCRTGNESTCLGVCHPLANARFKSTWDLLLGLFANFGVSGECRDKHSPAAEWDCVVWMCLICVRSKGVRDLCCDNYLKVREWVMVRVNIIRGRTISRPNPVWPAHFKAVGLHFSIGIFTHPSQYSCC